MKKILIVAFFTLFSSQVMSNDFSWSFPPTVLSSTSLNSSDPQIAIDSNGNVVAAWVENGFVKSKAKPINMSWTSSVTVSGTAASSPRIVSDLNGNATAVWLESGVVKGATKPFNGNWSSSSSLSSSGASSPDLAVDSAGDVVAVWTRSGNVESSTKLFGASWQSRVTISSTGATSPHVAIGSSSPNTRAVVVWQGTSGSTNVVYSSTKLISGSWSTQQALSDTSHNAAFASVAVDSNANATAVWYSYDVVGSIFSNVVVQAASRPVAGNWGALTSLSTAGMRNPANLVARVAYDGFGNAIALWNTSFDDETFTIESAIKPVNQNWNPSIQVVNSNLYAYDVGMATSAFGDALAVYMFYNGSSLMIQSSESDMSGFMENFWSIPTSLSAGVDNAFPRVAATVTGNVINAAAIWINSNGINNIVDATTGAKSIVLPPTNLSVSQNADNFGVFQEYFNTLGWHASTDPHVAGYLIYRNGVFIEEVSASVLNFVDHNRVQNGSVTYGVAAVNNLGSRSRIVTVSFP